MEDPKLPDATTGSTTVDAPAGGVKAPEDVLAELKAKDEKIAKLAIDKENYRIGMLKYKRELEADPDNKDLDEQRVKQMIQEAMIESELGRELADKNALVEKIAKENSEMKIALANKSQISNMPGGSSSSPDITVEGLTDEQKAHFDKISKEIGVPIDPKKFLENWKKSQQK